MKSALSEIEFIAELGACWNGDYFLLDMLVRECKELGFDAVKFQSFDSDHYLRHPEFPRLPLCSVTDHNIPTIDAICNHHGMEWFSMPTKDYFVPILDPYVKRFKVRFKDRFNIHVLEAIRKTHKPYFVSTDMHRNINDENKHDLYCIPNYPTKYTDIDFIKLSKCYGYSNHCKDFRAIINAIESGSKMIEIHITPTHAVKTIDDSVSFDPLELTRLFEMIKINA